MDINNTLHKFSVKIIISFKEIFLTRRMFGLDIMIYDYYETFIWFSVKINKRFVNAKLLLIYVVLNYFFLEHHIFYCSNLFTTKVR